ncbi:fimbria/pilus outer membrane usher protein [Brucella sp. TWI432]
MLSIKQPRSPGVKITLVVWCLLMAGTGLTVGAQEIKPPDNQAQTLMLGVVINDQPTDAFATFRRLPNGRFAATSGDLQSAGLKSEAVKPGPDGLINLDRLPGVTWRYDESKQLIIFTAPDSARIPNKIELESPGKPIDFSKIQSNLGFVLNYTLYGSADWGNGSRKAFSGSFDARILTPFGVTSTSALGKFDPLVDKTLDFRSGFTRLESSWRYTDPKRALVYQVGDSVSGSLPWTSSWRFGGIQFKRNFAIRPDLITSPVPNLSGSASLPSTLDLYLNNNKVYSGDVPAGPFDFSGMPFLTGGGNINLVMRDALGREVRTEHAYYYGPNMLGKGVFDFSTELGFPRFGFGEKSFEYDQNIAGSASVAYGLTNWLTVNAHFEATKGLINGGSGFVTSLGAFGSLSASYAASRLNDAHQTEIGSRASVNYQVGYKGISFYIGTSHSFGQYADIGLVADRRHGNITPVSARARSIDTIGVSLPLVFDPSFININFSRVRGAGKEDDASLLDLSWSRNFFKKISFFATGYTDLYKKNNYGIFAGLSVSLGDNMAASINADNDGISTSLTKSARFGEDPVSWSLRDRERFRGESSRSATVNYHAPVGQFSGSVDQSGGIGRVTATVDGALVIAGQSVFFVNQTNDAFAIVKGGGPDTKVSLNGRYVANTNSRGRAFVPDLQSYQDNTVTLDPTNLPADLQPDNTTVNIVPADRSGVVVDFGTKRLNAATVVLINAEGKPLPAGAEVLREGSDQPFIMGYDGRVWLTDLADHNNLTVTLPEGLGACHASFNYKPVNGTIAEINGVVCQSNGV